MSLTVYGDFNHDGRRDARPFSGTGFLILPHLAAPRADRQALSTRAEQLTLFRVVSTARFSPGPSIVVTVPVEARSATRLFLPSRSRDGQWESVDGAQVTLKNSDLGNLDIGIAAVSEQSRPVSLRFDLQVSVGGGNDTLHVPCRVAPALLASSLDPVEEVWAVRNTLTRAFCERLSGIVAKVAGKPTLHWVDYDMHPSDVWMQDTMEICRAPVPGGGRQPVVPLLGLRGSHDMGLECAGLDAAVARAWQARPDAVPIQPGQPRSGARWIDWYGNLEVSPPVPDFPQGRLLIGEQRGLHIHPDLLRFLETQQVQWPPLSLDVSWLTIGHVDELINFVPAKNGKGFRALLPSPTLARQVLEAAVKNGQGATAVFPGKKGETTVGRLLEEVALSPETRMIEAALRDTRARLRDGLKLTDADIVEMPVLFKDGLPVIPNGVNCLVLGRDIVMPDPCGPRVGRGDIFQKAIRDALVPLGLRLHFVDIWEPYHVRSGEIHCATNAVRRLAHPRWWQT